MVGPASLHNDHLRPNSTEQQVLELDCISKRETEHKGEICSLQEPPDSCLFAADEQRKQIKAN